MDEIISELESQYLAALEMFRLSIENCPDEMWNRVFGDESPYWKEAYHCIFWFYNWLGDSAKQWHPVPFGKDIDPRLFNKPDLTCTRDEIMGYSNTVEDLIRSVFSKLTLEELRKTESGGRRKRTVINKMLYGLRHAQHHTGKLTGYLFSHGIDYDPWR